MASAKPQKSVCGDPPTHAHREELLDAASDDLPHFIVKSQFGATLTDTSWEVGTENINE